MQQSSNTSRYNCLVLSVITQYFLLLRILMKLEHFWLEFSMHWCLPQPKIST